MNGVLQTRRLKWKSESSSLVSTPSVNKLW